MGDFVPSSTIQAPVAYYTTIAMTILTIVGPAVVVISFIAASVTKTTRTKRRWYVALYYALAWCGFDLMVLSAFSGSLEMEEIAKWILNNKFGAECAAAEQLLQDDCVTLDTSFGIGFYYGIVALASV